MLLGLLVSLVGFPDRMVRALEEYVARLTLTHPNRRGRPPSRRSPPSGIADSLLRNFTFSCARPHTMSIGIFISNNVLIE